MQAQIVSDHLVRCSAWSAAFVDFYPVAGRTVAAVYFWIGLTFKFIGRSRAPLKTQGTVCPFLPSFAVRSTPTWLDRGCICCSQNCHRQTGRSSGNPSEFLPPFCR